MLPNLRGFMKPFKISSSQFYLYSLPLFQKDYNHPIYFPSFHHLLKLITLLSPRKVVTTSILKIQIEIYVWRREPQMIWIHFLKKRKRKEVKKDPNLVANGRFQCLVALGRRRRETLNPKPSHFPPNKFYLNLHFFFLILEFYFIMVLGRYLHISFIFLDL